MTSSAPVLPQWDMSVVFPSLDSSEFSAAFGKLRQDITDLATLFDQHHVEAQPAHPLDDATRTAVDVVLARYNALIDEVTTLGAYIAAFISTNSRDTVAQARDSEFDQEMVRLSLLGTRFVAWVGSLDVEGLIASSDHARDHAYLLRLSKEEAAHQMSPAEEALAAQMNVVAGSAWSRLHGTITSQLAVPISLNGQAQEVPMSTIRNLASDSDRQVRRTAYEAEIVAWERNAAPLAAALNSIKGEVNLLTEKRRWASPLDQSLFGAHIDRATLDAMLGAARESFPTMRRYLKAKAKALGLPALAWYDIFAPVGATQQTWSFEDASNFIVRQFGGYSPKMGEFAARAFRERWIDAEPRPGKRDGAFCMPLRADESRILANFKPSYDGMSTLAHELGHGYHNLNLAARTPLQRDTPMTLAETASIFCETIVLNATLRQVGPGEKLSILEEALQNASQLVLDIYSRFLFESAVFEKRRERELSIDEFNDLMLDAQRQTYGDGLDQNALHPYMWAVKGHYYSTGLSYYNYPYMFGFLFGLGLYKQYEQNPDRFRAQYDELLSLTGQGDAATLAARFGIDIRKPDFWEGSLQVCASQVEQFEALVNQMAK